MVLQTSESTESEPNQFSEVTDTTLDSLTNDFQGDKPEVPSKTFHTSDTDGSPFLASANEKKYIASLDVGTTMVRCFIYDKKAQICAEAQDTIHLLHPKPGYVEMSHEELWHKAQLVLQRAVAEVGVSNIVSLGLCTQRCSFLLWDGSTGEPLHNIITWKDLRADQLVNQWNCSILMKLVRWACQLLFTVTRNERFKGCSVLRFMNTQVILRLKWVLTECAEVRAFIAKGGKVMFGTLDTWLVYKFTAGKVYASEFSNASGTAMFDPYQQEWSGFVIGLVGIPRDILPPLRTSAGDWGSCDQEILGEALPITGVVSDQGASMAGGGGYAKGHVKVTLGTGAFLNLNTGAAPHTSVKGIYPVVGWQDKDGGLIYMAEGSANDMGSVVEWGVRVGLYDNVRDTSDLAESVPDTDGVYFVPAFHGLQAPVNDSNAGCGFIGVTASTGRAHLVRALLESLAYTVYQLYELMKEEVPYDLLQVRADGGVSSNRCILQLIATLTQRNVTRYTNTELSGLGAAVIAGMGAGVYSSASDVCPLLEEDCVFRADPERRDAALRHYRGWQRAVQRFRGWHKR